MLCFKSTLNNVNFCCKLERFLDNFVILLGLRIYQMEFINNNNDKNKKF